MTDDTTDATDASTSRRRFLLGGAAVTGALAVPTAGVLGSSTLTQNHEAREFQVRLENVSDGSTLQTSDGSKPVPMSPGAYAVHTADEPIFTPGEPARGNGLEEIAEDGAPPSKLAEALSARDSVTDAGAFATPTGADGPGPLLPGNDYEFTVEASAGKPTRYLSLVTMFVQSNDVFIALGGPDGLSLFADGEPNVGNVTDSLALWDAGTEINQEPGVGEHQAPRQPDTNVGDVERGTVAPIAEVNGYDYPPVDEVARLMVTPTGEGDG
jgi:hypothetical protein